jgi:hypothetical protein
MIDPAAPRSFYAPTAGRSGWLAAGRLAHWYERSTARRAVCGVRRSPAALPADGFDPWRCRRCRRWVIADLRRRVARIPARR